jgi:hypothetical protein
MSKLAKNKLSAPNGVWVWLCVGLCAPVHGSTVGKMIARLKQQKELENSGSHQSAANAQNISPAGAAPDKPLGMPKLPIAPLLWSLIGLDEDLQAVLVYQGKAYVAQANMPRSRMGPWWIESVTQQGVLLVLHDNPKAAPLMLHAPERGASIEPYALSLGVYRTTAVAAAAGPQQALRLNSGPSAISALWTAKEGDPLWLGTVPSDPKSGPLPDNFNPGPAPKQP